MTESPQDQPGPEWVLRQRTRRDCCGFVSEWYHPGLNLWLNRGCVAECRAISVAALAWEVKKRDALAAALCEREEI